MFSCGSGNSAGQGSEKVRSTFKPGKFEVLLSQFYNGFLSCVCTTLLLHFSTELKVKVFLIVHLVCVFSQ